MPRFFVTYEIVTPESAEQGDAEECGYLQPSGWHTDDEGEGWTLREVWRNFGQMIDCGRWFAEASSDPDYESGAEETRSVHPPRNITPASYARVRRILCGK